MLTSPEELMERGSRAEQALPYITELMESAKSAIFDRILELSANETFKFSVLKSELLCLEEIISLVHGDINAGKREISIIQGNISPEKGIL